MGLFGHKKFKDTLFGKILGGAAKALTVVAGVVIGGGVVKAVAGGIGNLLHIGGSSGAATGLSMIADKAKALVNGITTDQQKILDAAKGEAHNAAQKLKLASKLMKTGMSKADAYSQAGITDEEAANVNHTEETSDYNENGTIEPQNYEVKKTALGTVKMDNKTLIYAGLGALALIVLPKFLKR